MRVIVYARTSGEERNTGQDVREQVAHVGREVEARGHQVVIAFHDDGVSGDVSPFERPGFREAVERARQAGAALAIKEFSRFSRGHPADAMDDWRRLGELGVPVLCLDEAAFSTAEKPDEEGTGSDTLLLVRFISMWTSWKELRTLRERTQSVMTAIKDKKRLTKSGKRPGRPVKSITPEELERVREMRAAGESPNAWALAISTARGAFSTPDAKLRRARSVSRQTLLRALEAAEPGQKVNLSKTRKRPAKTEPGAKGSDLVKPDSAGVRD